MFSQAAHFNKSFLQCTQQNQALSNTMSKTTLLRSTANNGTYKYKTKLTARMHTLRNNSSDTLMGKPRANVVLKSLCQSVKRNL